MVDRDEWDHLRRALEAHQRAVVWLSVSQVATWVFVVLLVVRVF